jgi:cell cycle checkpoint protein
VQPSKDTLELIIEGAHGDIRAAVMALQFACRVPAAGMRGTAKGKKGNGRLPMEAVTQREQSLALFHLMGKVLWNKREGDVACL